MPIRFNADHPRQAERAEPFRPDMPNPAETYRSAPPPGDSPHHTCHRQPTPAQLVPDMPSLPSPDDDPVQPGHSRQAEPPQSSPGSSSTPSKTSNPSLLGLLLNDTVDDSKSRPYRSLGAHR